MSRGLKAVLSVAVLLGVLGCGGGSGGIAPAVTSVSAPTFAVGGRVTGLAPGGRLVLLNNGGDAVTVQADGSFTFPAPVPRDGAYAVTVGTQPSGQLCTVSRGVGTAVRAAVSDVQVTCSAQSHTVGGTVSGLAGGQQVTLLNNGAGPLTVGANGSFTFPTPVARHGAYAVTVGTQPSGQWCTVQNKAGSNVTANVTGVSVSCSPCATTLSGALMTSTTYTAAGGPYCIAGTLRIPNGMEAYFDAGAAVSGGRILVEGNLRVIGSSGAMVRLTDVDIVPAGLVAAQHDVSIWYADVRGGSIFAPTATPTYGALLIYYSRITDLASTIEILDPWWINTIAYNVFLRSGGIVYSLDSTVANLWYLSIYNNHFSDWTSGAAIESRGEVNASAAIHGNTFASTSKVAVKLPGGFPNAAMDARHNYWGTTDPLVIDSMVHDKRVDPASAGFVTTTPFLSSPDPNTPVP
ncbi:MAG TPA: hypothetical protein VFE82_11000 [Ramlibacter sp.]|jgi:hypothetical protein|uniref:hypothetical protein n=1 Tax=Ramlibacter sp. TaxID=1917967 RepID=UPI002D38E61E|nr:hypothetical protein [Ramlibacter sp.]HZY19000.1 hypothetical protein [Ramlibacter sp.]